MKSYSIVGPRMGQKQVMEESNSSPLLVCYISGMDVRRLRPEITPYISDLMAACPHSLFANLPSNELFPTLVTGVNPVTHGVWGVQYAKNDVNSVACRIVDAIPDTITTSFQCLRHFVDSTFDLPAIPPHRRRNFRMTRTKYKRRSERPEALFNIGGVPTVMGLAGSDRAHYSFSSDSDPVKTVLPRLCANGSLIEILELYSLDRHQQWNLDRPDETERFYGVIDDFVQKLHEKCRKKNIVLMIVSDHGHEEIRESIDIRSIFEDICLTDNDVSYFIEVSSARLWPHTERARSRITERLSSIETGKLLRYDQMDTYNVPLTDDRYGELFFFLDPGYIFFPHDFHHPLARLYFGLTDPMQRSRLRDARHKGNHGHLHYFDAEQSLMLLADANFEVDSSPADILDVAPSMLSVVGIDPPTSMVGRSLFRRPG